MYFDIFMLEAACPAGYKEIRNGGLYVATPYYPAIKHNFNLFYFLRARRLNLTSQDTHG
jgi:hypothetical protein